MRSEATRSLPKNMGVNVAKYKVVAFTLAGLFFGLQSILTISFGTSMTSAANLSSMSRNFTPLMGTFFGLAFKKYGHPVIAIVIGEMIIQLMFNGFVALGAPTTIQKCRYRRGTACDCGADDKAGQGSCGEIRRNDNGRNIIKSG